MEASADGGGETAGSGRLSADALRAVARRQLNEPSFQDVLGETDLSPAQLIEEVVRHRDEIAAELATPLAQIDELEALIEAAKTRRSALFGALLIALLSLLAAGLLRLIGLPAWVYLGILGAGLLLGGTSTVATLTSRDSRRQVDPLAHGAKSGQEISLEKRLASVEGNLEPRLERAVSGWITERINLEVGEIFSPILPELDPRGLAEIDDSEHEISTEAGDELGSLFGRMPGGSIGVSGPRGAGKTTLIDKFTANAKRLEPARVSVGVAVDAPVDYDAREFVLHLFARLCEAELGPKRVSALRAWDRSPETQAAPSLRALRGPLPPILGPLLIAAGAIFYVMVLDARQDLNLADMEAWAFILIGAGTALTYLTLILNPSRLKEWLRLSSRRHGTGAALTTAELRLRQILFQRTFSTGWSGGLKLPVGMDARTERNAQVAERQLSFPDIVSLYKDFVEQLAADGQVRIGIDELDKMDDERARRFLNEIKVIFRISGCFYVVSVSEDAMSYFERRGLPLRDVFDSSFDDVLQVGYLPYKDSHRILRRRMVGIPIQFVSLCHMLGGGLARDVIRLARDICHHPQDTRVTDLAALLCAQQIRSKCLAARVGIRRIKDPARMSLLSRWIATVEAAADYETVLLDVCRNFEQEFVRVLGPAPPEDSAALIEHREVLSSAFEILAFAYFTITVRSLVESFESETATRDAIENAAVDRLAEARQAFSVDPSEAWGSISSVRSRTLSVEHVPQPSLDPRVTVDA